MVCVGAAEIEAENIAGVCSQQRREVQTGNEDESLGRLAFGPAADFSKSPFHHPAAIRTLGLKPHTYSKDSARRSEGRAAVLLRMMRWVLTLRQKKNTFFVVESLKQVSVCLKHTFIWSCLHLQII